jgi:hypothetical protein
MGGVFFRRRRRPRKEVINDISADVVNLFRLLQRHFQQLLDVLKWQVCSRAEFERLMAVDPSTLTDLERAARFLYLQRTAFGGKVRPNFGVTLTGGARFDLTKLVPMLEDVHERLCGVDIERLPYAELIARYDTPGRCSTSIRPTTAARRLWRRRLLSGRFRAPQRPLRGHPGALHHVDQRHARDPRDLRRLHDRGGRAQLSAEREGDAGAGADYKTSQPSRHWSHSMQLSTMQPTATVSPTR